MKDLKIEAQKCKAKAAKCRLAMSKTTNENLQATYRDLWNQWNNLAEMLDRMDRDFGTGKSLSARRRR